MDAPPSPCAAPPLGSKSKEDLADMIKERDGIILRQSRKIEKLEQLVAKLQKEHARLVYENNELRKSQQKEGNDR